ncbi:MAG: hypothetical protein ABII26_06120 [Pseudomonadota bacterium]
MPQYSNPPARWRAGCERSVLVRRHRLWPTVSAGAISTLRNAMEDGLRRVEAS